MSGISVVICAYNEEQSVEKTVQEAQNVLTELSQPHEIILVDDGSTDNTFALITRLTEQHDHIKSIRHPTNQGMGISLKDGFQNAQYDWVTFLPGDGQIDPSYIAHFCHAMEGVDFVTSYYVSRNDGMLRKILSAGMRAILFIIWGKHPRLEGTYMFHRTILDSITLTSPTFVMNFEFVAKAAKKGFKYKEIGMNCRKRETGQSKVANIKKIIKVFCEILRVKL